MQLWVNRATCGSAIALTRRDGRLEHVELRGDGLDAFPTRTTNAATAPSQEAFHPRKPANGAGLRNRVQNMGKVAALRGTKGWSSWFLRCGRPRGGALRRPAISPTNHRRVGCGIGEVTGMLIATVLGW
jgi:hypothetical protein